jgi:outer membrane protein assembly factor BamB/calcineurin-like phosphoesterase family protein
MLKFILPFLFSSGVLLSQTFTFAHITDTHIGSATAAEDLRRTVNDLNSMHGVAFALITGDITEYGSDDHFREAKQILDSLTLPWYIVPGNHDMKWSESGGSSFAKIFGTERFVFDFTGFTFIGLHQGPRMRMGDGYWAPEDIAWFDSVMQRMPDPRRPIIMATHYPADSGIANWYVMTERLKKYNTQVLLNGHWHQNRSALFEGIPSVIGRSNLRGKEPVGGYNLVTVRNDSMIYAVRIPGVETKKPWAVVQLGERDFSQVPIIVPQQSDPGTAQIRWQSRSASSMTSAPAVWKDYIAAGYSNGTVVVRSLSNGKELFTVPLGGGVFASPAMDAGYLVVPSADSNLYCIELKRKSVKWKLKTNASLVASPAIRNCIVFTGASDRVFRAVDLKTGELLWHFDSLAGFIEARPAIADGKVIVGAWDEHLYCFNEQSGEVIWKWKGDKQGILLSPAACEPVVSHGKVFIVAPDRFMTAIDLASGKEVWRTKQFQVRETIGLSEDGERVYVRTMNDSLYALSSHTAVPEIVWGINAGFGYDINPAQIKEKDGIAFYATMKGLLYVINGANGQIINTLKEDVVIAHTPVPLSKDRVIFSNINGTIMDVSWGKKK